MVRGEETKAYTGRMQYMQDIASILSSCKTGWRCEVGDAAGSMSARVKFNFNKKTFSDSLLLASYTMDQYVILVMLPINIDSQKENVSSFVPAASWLKMGVDGVFCTSPLATHIMNNALI